MRNSHLTFRDFLPFKPRTLNPKHFSGGGGFAEGRTGGAGGRRPAGSLQVR